MAKYVMSDLHGCYNKFIKMLDKIHFCDKDELYILGDILDRGKNPLDILDYIISHKNIHLILGNHEDLFIDYCLTDDLTLWMINGGNTTYNQLMQKGCYYTENMVKYFKKLPFIKVIDNFILVHGGLNFCETYEQQSLYDFLKIQDKKNCLWTRSNINNEKQFKNYTIIAGHTSVQAITGDYKNAKILHRKGHIYIDCCCYLKVGKLACLRLDDMKEFYI